MYMCDEHDEGLEMLLNSIRLNLQDPKTALKMLILLQELFAVRPRIPLDQILELGIVEGELAGGARGLGHPRERKREKLLAGYPGHHPSTIHAQLVIVVLYYHACYVQVQNFMVLS